MIALLTCLIESCDGCPTYDLGIRFVAIFSLLFLIAIPNGSVYALIGSLLHGCTLCALV